MAMYVARSLAASFIGQSSPRGELSGLALEAPSGLAPLWASAAPPGARQAIATKNHGLTLRMMTSFACLQSEAHAGSLAARALRNGGVRPERVSARRSGVGWRRGNGADSSPGGGRTHQRE